MNFTREPIIETVITPREGCKLVVRSSKGNGQEDYFVDAVEVVSFGHSFFVRSLERPKSFLVPVSDYEILELKETRMVLKNVGTERSHIKIGGGREAPPKQQQSRENAPSEAQEEVLSESRPAPFPERPAYQHPDRKRDKRRRGRRGRDRRELSQQQPHSEMHERPSHPEESATAENPDLLPSEPIGEEVKAPSFISKLFPPPPTLIKETLSRYKPQETPEEEKFDIPEAKPDFEETIFEHPAVDTKTESEDESEE